MEYCGLYNWTTDVPQGTRVFENILEMFRSKEEPKILEVGTFAGTSIATMKNILPHSVCYAIDNWTLVDAEFSMCKEHMTENKINSLSEVRDYFFKNTEGKEIILYEMDSALALQTLNREGKTFDFIYVDASHTAGDTLIDVVLSWTILNKGGVLGIDDYLYIPRNNDINDRPEIGVNYFLNKFSGQYIILNKGYRIFLQKIS